MPMGFCNPPVCWMLTYDFTKARIRVMNPADVPTWNKGTKAPLAMFPAEVAAFTAQMNAGATYLCDKDCVCVRLHKNAVTAKYDPMYMCPHPTVAGLVLYMEKIEATGHWGMCLPKKGSIRIKKGDDWVYPENLPDTDILTPPPSSPGGGSGSGGKKKKGKKGPKKRRR
jgi:hypothetical protein